MPESEKQFDKLTAPSKVEGQPTTEETQTTQQQEKKPNLPENVIDVQDSGTLKKKVTITILRARINAKYNEMFGELANTTQIPGFRIGHAPRRLIEKRFGKEISQDVRNAMVAEAISPALEKSALKTVGEPDIDLDKIELPADGDLTFNFEVEVMPEFDLPKLEGIEVKKVKLEMTEKRIDEYLEQLRVSRARFEATDKPAEEGDMVLAGARISGADITTLERHGLNLRVAPGQIEGLPLVELGKVLAGKKAGSSVKLTVKVPEAHPNKDWHGKELTIEIQLSEIRRRVLPAIDEEFTRSMGFEKLSDLRQFINTRMQTRIENELQQSMRDQVCKYLLENTKFDLPEAAAKRYAVRVLQRRYVDLLNRSVPQEQINERLTELQAAATEQARGEMKLSFILGKIAEEQKVTLEEGEVNSRIAQMAAEQGRRPERLKQELSQDGTLSALEDSLREGKVLDNLLAKARISEVEAAEAEKPTAKVKEKQVKAKVKAKKAEDKPKAEKSKSKKAAAEEKPKARKPAKKKGKE